MIKLARNGFYTYLNIKIAKRSVHPQAWHDRFYKKQCDSRPQAERQHRKQASELSAQGKEKEKGKRVGAGARSRAGERPTELTEEEKIRRRAFLER